MRRWLESDYLPTMANPQTEDGFTRIANEIVEALLQTPMNGTELKCILFVLRKTYGWNKKEDSISITQFENSVKASRPAICKALKGLVVNKVLLVNKSLLINKYSLNKDYTEWLVNKPLLVNKTNTTSKQNDTQLVNKPLHTKDTITKEIYTKETTTMEIWNSLKFKNKELIPEIESLIERFGLENVKNAATKLVGKKLGGDEGSRWIRFVNWCNTEEKPIKNKPRGITITE